MPLQTYEGLPPKNYLYIKSRKGYFKGYSNNTFIYQKAFLEYAMMQLA